MEFQMDSEKHKSCTLCTIPTDSHKSNFANTLPVATEIIFTSRMDVDKIYCSILGQASTSHNCCELSVGSSI